ncbi:nucleoside triphosphate pyrophosphohydrolase family protein [Neisseria sp. P0017.S007]|uniref:nucleoside triphosphate pyrophosphohydrolase family protein n=1 Tax=unclassified Neisseria TaxID=2623750 RepID=UPI003F8116F9
MDIQEIIEWFKAAKPEPTEKDKATQIGCHFEEVSEMLQALSCIREQVDDVSQEFYSSDAIDKDIDGKVMELPENWQIELLDSLCDQIVTAIGVGYMMGFDMVGALDEVNKSNWSKFKDGAPVFDENGKIAKAEGYFKPDLTKFLKVGEK